MVLFLFIHHLITWKVWRKTTMSFGFKGKIARINLTSGKITVEIKEESFYKKLLGGRNLAAYIMLNEIPSDADPLGPDNKLIAATSVLTGTPVPGASRHTLAGKSPLTGGFGDSEAGGFWGPELKFAGYDALIVEGQSAKPVYIFIKDDDIQIKDASHLWGKETGIVQEIIQEENNDKKIRVLQTGIAGENLVKFAAVTNNLKHWNGRGGLGAVMGSKKLRAIAVRGSGKTEMKNPEKVLEFSKWFSQNLKNDGISYFAEYGTSSGVSALDSLGILPTENFKKGSFEYASDISGEKMHDELLTGREGCLYCPVKCKRSVGFKGEKVEVDKKYGGPEFETIGSFGSACAIKDLQIVCKANELCGKYGLDTISTGMTIAFAMECYENNIITKEDTNGMDLKFGNADILLKLIEMIAKRESFGDVLAEGSYRAARKFNKGAEKYVMTTKKQEFAAHDPRGKWNIGLGYAVSPTGADHLVVAHDHSFINEPDLENKLGGMDLGPLSYFGIREPIELESLDSKKVRLFVHLQYLWSLYSVLDLCNFIGVPERRMASLEQILSLVNDVCGWDLGMWEFIKTGEKGIQMARMFNIKHGITKEWDTLPDRMFEPLENGAIKGSHMNRKEFEDAIELYYQMMGWDENGKPTKGKFAELGLEALMVQ